jgi:hypothetical protein
MAWVGNSGGYIPTVIDLGSKLNGQTVTLRFRTGMAETYPNSSCGYRIGDVCLLRADNELFFVFLSEVTATVNVTSSAGYVLTLDRVLYYLATD